MSGTPEKILEHLLETIKLDSNGNDAIGAAPGPGPGPGLLTNVMTRPLRSPGLLSPSCRAVRQRLSSHPQGLHALQPAVFRTAAPISCQHLNQAG